MKKAFKKIDAPAVVAAAAFFASAGHIVTVVSETDHMVFALAYPLGIDGLLYVGMKAIKEKRFWVGVIALVVGTFFSLAFNGHATGALVAPKWVIAFSMPICLLAAFVIEHIGKKTKVEEAPAPAAIPAPAAPVAIPAPPIRWVSAGVRRTLPIVPRTAPPPAPVKVKSTVGRTGIEGRTSTPAIEGRVDGRTLRPASWDVEKAVRMLTDGQTNADVAAVVGTNDKAVQRAKRAMRIMDVHPHLKDEEVSQMMGRVVGPAHVGRIRAAMEKVSA